MARYPSLFAGQKLTAALLQSMIEDWTIKAGTSTRTSTVTVTPDAELTAIALPLGTHYVEFRGLMAGAVGAATGGFQCVWNFTGTASGFRTTLGMAAGSATASTGTIMRTSSANLTSTGQTYGTYTGQLHIIETAIVTVSVAGNLSIDWAQGVSNATATTLAPGSYVKWKQVA